MHRIFYNLLKLPLIFSNSLTASVELYEGTTQANSTVWTSFDAPPLPTIEQQAFIIPATVVSLRETITEKGITSKHVLSK